ncbi:MAG: vWA domain-containing protein [Planctomycetota bacterium]
MNDSALDLALLIDTTGSMGPYLAELRRQLLDVVGELRRHVADLRCGVVAFKDHGESYVTRVLPPTRSLAALVRFLQAPELEAGLGGGGAEALECALREAARLRWRADARRVALVIGDKPPHGAGLDGFAACACGVDYRDELERLAAAGVSVYSLRVGRCLEAQRVFEYFAARTGGRFLDRVHVRDLASSIVSVCHREAGDLEAYRRRLERGGRLTPTRAEMLLALAG